MEHEWRHGVVRVHESFQQWPVWAVSLWLRSTSSWNWSLCYDVDKHSSSSTLCLLLWQFGQPCLALQQDSGGYSGTVFWLLRVANLLISPINVPRLTSNGWWEIHGILSWWDLALRKGLCCNWLFSSTNKSISKNGWDSCDEFHSIIHGPIFNLFIILSASSSESA